MRLLRNTQHFELIAGRNKFLTYNAGRSHHPGPLLDRDVLESRLGRFSGHEDITKVLADCTTGKYGMNLG
jgi:hypothetical protein